MPDINILVVDDEKEIADLIEIYLVSDGYKVFKAENGKIIVPYDTDDAFAECETGFHILNALKATWERA